jgi:hypothetical protein
MRPVPLPLAALLLALLVSAGCAERSSKPARGPKKAASGRTASDSDGRETPPTGETAASGSETPPAGETAASGSETPPTGETAASGSETPPTGETAASGSETPPTGETAASGSETPPTGETAASGSETPPTAAKRRPTPPKVNHLVTVADLVGVLATKGWVSEGPIPGVSPRGDYNSVLYTRPGSTHMVGVRIWEYRQHRDAVERWNALLATHPNAEVTEAVARDTFFWTRGSVAGLVFLEADRSRVVGVSCHNALCNDTQLLQIAAIAHGRAK